METVLNISKAVGAWSKSKGLSDGQWIFTPSSGDMSDQGRFILMTGWGSWEEMGKPLQGFFGDGKFQRFLRYLQISMSAATCETQLLDCYQHLQPRHIQ